jgi:hypothetical protein
MSLFAVIASTVITLHLRLNFRLDVPLECDLWLSDFMCLYFGIVAYDKSIQTIKSFDVKNIKQKQVNKVENFLMRELKIMSAQPYSLENITKEQFNAAKNYVELVQNKKLVIFLVFAVSGILNFLIGHYLKTWGDLQNLVDTWLL